MQRVTLSISNLIRCASSSPQGGPRAVSSWGSHTSPTGPRERSASPHGTRRAKRRSRTFGFRGACSQLPISTADRETEARPRHVNVLHAHAAQDANPGEKRTPCPQPPGFTADVDPGPDFRRPAYLHGCPEAPVPRSQRGRREHTQRPGVPRPRPASASGAGLGSAPRALCSAPAALPEP